MTGASAKTPWAEVLLIWAAGLGAAAQYGKVSVVFAQLDQVYPTAGASVSLAVSLVGVCGIFLGAAAGLLAARLGYRRILILCLWVGAGMGLLQGLHLPFWAFLASRAIEGASHLGIVVAGPTLIATLAAVQHRNLVMTLWGTFFGVSFALTSLAAGVIVVRFGVAGFFAAHGAVMAVLALGLSVFLRRPAAPAPQKLPSVAGWLALHRRIYAAPRKIAPAAGWFFYAASFVAMLTVLPPYIDPAWRSVVMTALPLVSIASSMTVGVALTRRFPAVLVIMLGFGGSVICASGLGLSGGAAGFAVALGAALGLVQGASFAAIPQLNPEAADQAAANGAMAQAGNLGNFVGTPVLVFAIAVGGFSAMVATLILLYCGGVLVHLALSRAGRYAQA